MAESDTTNDTPLAGVDVYAASSRLREQYDRVQTKTFTKWWNSYLKERNLSITDLTNDVKSGVMLANLLEVMTNSKLNGKIDTHVRFPAQMLSNLEICFTFLKTKVDPKLLQNIGPNDIATGNAKLILGLTWVLILRFVIMQYSADTQELLRWIKKRTHGYRDVHVENFTSSFQDGLVLNALIHAHFPEMINYDSLDKANAIHNLNNAFDVAERELGVPKLLDAIDVANEPDEKSMITYIARLRQALAERDEALKKSEAEDAARRRALAEEEARRRAAEEEARRKAAEEEARRKAEEDARRRAAEEEARRLAAEEARRLAELAAADAKDAARRKALEDLAAAMPAFMEYAQHEANTNKKNKEFDELAAELASWMKEKDKNLKGNTDYLALTRPDDVQALLDKVIAERKPGEDKLLAANALANDLETRAQLEGRPQPSHPVGIKELNQKWDALAHVYDGYKAGLLEHMRNLQTQGNAVDRVRRYLKKSTAWYEKNESALQKAELGNSVAEVTALIAEHERLTRDAQSEIASLKKIDAMAATIKEKPSDVSADIALVHSKFDTLPDKLARRSRDLQQSLERQRALEAQRLAFVEATKQFGQLIFDAEEVVDNPLPLLDTEASLRQLVDSLNRLQPVVARSPEATDTTESDNLLARFRALIPRLEGLREDIRTSNERKARLDEAQRRYAKAAQQFQDWYAQQTAAFETPASSAEVLRNRVNAAKQALPEGQVLLAHALTSDQAARQLGSNDTNPYTSLTAESLQKEMDALKQWIDERQKLLADGLQDGDRAKVVQSLDVLQNKKGVVSHGELQSYLPADETAYLESKFKPQGNDEFSYADFASKPTHLKPSSVSGKEATSPSSDRRRSNISLATDAANAAHSRQRIAEPMTPTLPSPTPESIPIPRFNDADRQKKVLDDDLYLYSTPNNDRMIRYEIDNKSQDEVEFEINFEGSFNVRVLVPETSQLRTTTIVPAHQLKVVAILLAQVDKKSDASMRVRYSWK